MPKDFSPRSLSKKMPAEYNAKIVRSVTLFFALKINSKFSES
jgi:hypothetical protein